MRSRPFAPRIVAILSLSTCLGLVLSADLVAAAPDSDELSVRQATREAAESAGLRSPVAVVDGAPRLPAARDEEKTSLRPHRREEFDAREGERPAGRSLSTIIGEAGMAVPLGGDDVQIRQSADLDGAAWLRIASDGTYFGAIVENDDVQVFRSEDHGETWSHWSTFADPDGGIYFLPGFEVVEGNVDRLMVAYSVDVGSEGEVRLAYADPHVAVPTWTVVTALAGSGIDHGENLRVDFATDAAVYPDYYVYVIAQSEDGNGSDIWFARSVNQGGSFEAGYRIASSGVGGYIDHSEPTIAYGSDNYLHVAYFSNDGSGTGDVNYRRAPQWADGGSAAWSAEQAAVPVPASGYVIPASLVAPVDADDVYLTLFPFGNDDLPRLCWSRDQGASWPVGNRTNSPNIPRGSGMAPLILPGGEMVMGGTIVSSDDEGFLIDVVESRSTTADPSAWSAPQSYSNHRWSGAGTYARIETMVPDPVYGNRLAVLWRQTYEPGNILRFDAQWRRDPGYPNTDVGFPRVIAGGGYTPPAVAEIDGDPELEIVFGTREGYVYVVNHDGTTVAGWPTYIGGMPYDTPVAVGDLDGDGTPSIVAGNTTGMVYAWQPNGSPEPGWPVTMDVESDVFVSIGALGGPHARYVVALCGQEMRAIAPDGQDVSPAWGTFTDLLTRPAAIGDVDGDGEAEIVTLKGSWLHVHNLAESQSETFTFFAGETFGAAPTLADMNNDGTLEIAAPTNAGTLYLLNHDGSSFSTDWPISVASGSALTAVSFANILGTSEPELVFGERSSSLVHIRWYDGDEGFSYPQASGSSYLYQPPMISPVNVSVANVNIGTTDFSTGEGTGQSWRNLGMVPDGWPKNLPGPVEETFASGDIDLDGRNELVIVGVDYLTVLDVGIAPENDPRGHWPMYAYDPQRTGCFDCGEIITSVDDTIPVAETLDLSAYPNPFNPATVIEYTVDRAGPVTLGVFDLSGRRVAVLVDDEHREVGRHTVDFAPRAAASGVYFVRLQSAHGNATRKVVLLK
jgi:hypothetical protein